MVIYKKTLLDIITKIIFLLFFCYLFWYQYYIGTIPYAIFVFGGFILTLTLIRINPLYQFKYLLGVLFFLFAAFISSILFSSSVSVSISFLIKIFTYYLCCIGVFTFIGNDFEKFKSVLRIIIFPIILLCISSFRNPEVYQTGAITVGSLNTNVFSTFLTLFLIACLILLVSDSKNKIIYLGLILLGFVTQVNCASRRGFIVYIFICGSAFLLINVNSDKTWRKMLCWIALIGGCLALYYIIGNLSSYSNIPLVNRLLTKDTYSDQLRKYYKICAINLFKDSPLVGRGLGSVEIAIGMYSHSFYYELLSCVGLFGTGIMFSILVRNIMFLIKNKINEETYRVSLIMMLFIVSIFITGFAVVLIYDIIFYIMLALICSYRRILTEWNWELE